MQFSHSQERQMLADTLEKFIANETSVPDRAHHADQLGYDPALWAKLADLGIIGALFLPQAGGFGGTGFDIMVVCQVLGGGCVSTPMIEGPIITGHIAQSLGLAKPIENMIAGDYLPILAHLEPQGGLIPDDIEAVAIQEGDQWLVSGQKSVVKFGQSASRFLVTAKISGNKIGLFIVEHGAEGLSAMNYATIDGGQAMDLTLDAAPGILLSDDASSIVQNAMYTGMVALCAEALGIMEVLVGMTRDYLGTRKQFGKTLASFQALQHRFTEMMVSLETAKSAAIIGANALEAACEGDLDGNLEAVRKIHAAKYSLCQTGMHIAQEAVQMHGGIGVTWEYDLNHYVKRLVAIESELGDEDHHLSQFIALQPL